MYLLEFRLFAPQMTLSDFARLYKEYWKSHPVSFPDCHICKPVLFGPVRLFSYDNKISINYQ